MFLLLSIGIKGRSILFDLKTIHFPTSFPIDLMHLIYENIAINMFKLWTGKFFKDGSGQDIGNYVLSQTVWKTIGNEMNQIRNNFQVYIGRPPRNIISYYQDYKTV